MPENPFTYGNPISNPERFIGRRRETEQVFSRLLNAEGESSSIVGERRIGKTSLLHHLMHLDVRRKYGIDEGSYLFIYSDFQMIDPRTTPTRLAQRLIGQLARQCPDTDLAAKMETLRQSEDIDNFALSDLFDDIDTKRLHVVFLLDEFENITTNPNFGPDFFYGLRSLAIQHNLTLITSSRSELIELTHSEVIRSSPFFNIFANINLRPFTPEEANELIERGLAVGDVRFTPAEQDALLTLAGTHPFFLQVACHYLYAAHQQGLPPELRLEALRREYTAEAAPHLANYWKDSSDSDKIVLTALALLNRQGKASSHTFSVDRLRELYDRSEQTLARLEKRGLLVRSSENGKVPNGGYRLFCTALGDWIVAELTNTMGDDLSYDDWLKSNQGSLERLSREARSQLAEVLPKVSAKYRDLLIEWVSDPKNLIAVATLVRGVIGVA